MRSLIIGIGICIGVIAAGCKPPAGNATPQAAPSSADTADQSASTTAGPEDFTLSVSLNKVVEDGEETAFRRTHAKPTPDVIEKEVKSIDWAGAPHRPYVIIGRMRQGQVNQMKLQGTLKTPNEDGLCRLLWVGTDEGKYKALRSPSLDSVETAIPLLVSFSQDDGKWRKMIAWEDVSENE